jgi:transcription initiation factor TFIIIB Brf1 subunit/transcription initiation factor TFIIB
MESLVGDINAMEIEAQVEQCCKEKYTIEKEGFYVCINCGVTERFTKIYDENIYGFQNGKDCTFVHSIISDMYPESSIGTGISGNSKLAKRQQWNSMPYRERVIWEVSNDLNTRLNGVFSDNIISDAIYQYKKIYNTLDINRGKNKKGIVAACVYFAANNKHAKISPKRLAAIMDIDIATLNKSISVYIENTKLDFNLSKAEDYAQEYCNRYKINFKVQKLLIKLCNVIEDSDILSGSVPQNICLSGLYFILNETNQNTVSLKEICKEYNVSVNTINRILEIIIKNKNYLFSRLK